MNIAEAMQDTHNLCSIRQFAVKVGRVTFMILRLSQAVEYHNDPCCRRAPQQIGA